MNPQNDKIAELRHLSRSPSLLPASPRCRRATHSLPADHLYHIAALTAGPLLLATVL